MSYKLSKADVWAVDVMNRPGMLARVLESLRNAGAELEFMIARKAADTTSRVFLSPVKGKKQKAAAAEVGLVPATGMHCLRIEGPDKAGIGADITRAVADHDANLRGASAAAIGKKMVMHLAFESEADMDAAKKIVRDVVSGKKKGKKAGKTGKAKK
jgi:hypothetical protein